jgi:transposase
MPRFKAYDHGLQFLAVDLSRQLHPGSFEYALHHLIEHEIDLSEIEARYANDVAGAWAYDPRVLLKIVLLSYARGIISSRGMEAACCRDVQFMAVSGNTAPHFSTLANFVSSLGAATGKMKSMRTTQQPTTQTSRHPLAIRTVRHTKRGGLRMAILACRKQVLRQPRSAAQPTMESNL